MSRFEDIFYYALVVHGTEISLRLRAPRCMGVLQRSICQGCRTLDWKFNIFIAQTVHLYHDLQQDTAETWLRRAGGESYVIPTWDCQFHSRTLYPRILYGQFPPVMKSQNVELYRIQLMDPALPCNILSSETVVIISPPNTLLMIRAQRNMKQRATIP